MDPGEPNCCLMKLFLEIPLLTKNPKTNSSVTNAEFFEAALAFANDPKIMELAAKTCILLEQYAATCAKLGPDAKRQTQLVSVARWIHYTNQIESVGYEQESDTLSAINGVLAEDDPKRRDVSNHFDLLEIIWKHWKHYGGDVQGFDAHKVDPTKILKWHSQLFDGILGKDVLGRWRTTSCDTMTDRGRFYYPHNKIIEPAMKALCRIMEACLDNMNFKFPTPSTEQVVWVFALAAFVQFHLVDIHPFLDGNGRICRLMSKFVLDIVCPVPFPMFTNRVVYVDALMNGRKETKMVDAPKRLLTLLLESAVEHFTYMNDILVRGSTIVIVECSAEEVSAKLKRSGINDVNLQILLKSFASLSPGESATTTFEPFTYTLTKMPEIAA